jgi:hypothetical protein
MMLMMMLVVVVNGDDKHTNLAGRLLSRWPSISLLSTPHNFTNIQLLLRRINRNILELLLIYGHLSKKLAKQA